MTGKKSIYITHSQGGRVGWQTDTENMAAIVAIEPGETPRQALAREIKGELESEIAVGDYLTTIEYDYPAFHLSMQCFWCTIVDGTPVLKEHEAAKWLDVENLGSVAWLPADLTIIELIKEQLIDQVG